MKVKEIFLIFIGLINRRLDISVGLTLILRELQVPVFPVINCIEIQIHSKLELYNKLTEDRVNTLFKQLWFNELYDARVRGIR